MDLTRRLYRQIFFAVALIGMGVEFLLSFLERTYALLWGKMTWRTAVRDFDHLTGAILHAGATGIVAAIGFTAFFHFTVGRHLASQLDANRRSKRSRIHHVDHRNLPDNEIGDLLLAQEKLLFELEEHQNGLGRRLRDTEDSLIRASKLTTTGELTSTIMHDLRSPLSSIIGHAQMLQELEEDEQGSSRRIYIERILRASRHIDELIKRMSLFSRHEGVLQDSVDLVSCVSDTAMILEHHFKINGVDFVNEIEGTSATCFGNKQMIVQILVNLCSNAVDAMSELPEGCVRRVTVGGYGESAHWILTVKDTGPGIPSEHLPQIFQPFFTTKSEGKGTGLGLASCRDIANVLNGRIEASNMELGGACFRILLPRREVDLLDDAPPSSSPYRRSSAS